MLTTKVDASRTNPSSFPVGKHIHTNVSVAAQPPRHVLKNKGWRSMAHLKIMLWSTKQATVASKYSPREARHSVPQNINNVPVSPSNEESTCHN